MLIKVSKLEKALREERALRERQVSQLEGYTQSLEAELGAEHRRRLAEQLRAVIEGPFPPVPPPRRHLMRTCGLLLDALLCCSSRCCRCVRTMVGWAGCQLLPSWRGSTDNSNARAALAGAHFLMHKSTEVNMRHVWYSPSASALRWAIHRVGPGSALVQPPITADKNRERSMSLKNVSKVVSGAKLFPSRKSQGASPAALALPLPLHLARMLCWIGVRLLNML